jgi:hypothetical protein
MKLTSLAYNEDKRKTQYKWMYLRLGINILESLIDGGRDKMSSLKVLDFSLNASKGKSGKTKQHFSFVLGMVAHNCNHSYLGSSYRTAV